MNGSVVFTGAISSNENETLYSRVISVQLAFKYKQRTAGYAKYNTYYTNAFTIVPKIVNDATILRVFINENYTLFDKIVDAYTRAEQIRITLYYADQYY